jgi:hypothetical protein
MEQRTQSTQISNANQWARNSSIRQARFYDFDVCAEKKRIEKLQRNPWCDDWWPRHNSGSGAVFAGTPQARWDQ